METDAPMVSRWAKLAGLGEQIALSGTTFLATLACGRLLPHAEFAALGLAIALYYAVTGLHRNLVVVQFTLDSAGRAMSDRRPKVWDRLAVTVAALQAAAAIVGGLVLWALHLAPPWIAEGVVGGAALLLTAPVHDYSRYRCTTAGRGTIVALSGAAFFTCQAILIFTLLFGLKIHNGAVVAASLAVSYGAALAPMWFATRGLGVETGETVWALVRRQWPSAKLNVVSHGAYIAYTQLAVFLVAGRLGAGAAAAFIATRTLMNPVATIVTGLDNTQKVDVAFAEAHGGPSAVARLIIKQIVLILVVCAPYMLGAAIFSNALLKLAFGAGYAGNGYLIGWWCVSFAALICAQPLESALLALRLNKRLLSSRLLSAVIGAGFAWIGADYLGVAGAVVGMGVGMAVSAAVAADGLWRAARRQRVV